MDCGVGLLDAGLKVDCFVLLWQGRIMGRK